MNRPVLRKVTTAFLTASVVAALFVGVVAPFVNEDLYLSFAAGRDVYLGRVAAPDHWSFTQPGSVWVNQAWLSHLILYLTHERLGPVGVWALKVILFVAAIGLTVARIRQNPFIFRENAAETDTSTEAFTGASDGPGRIPALIALCLGITASGAFLGMRPENFGLFCLALFLWTFGHPSLAVRTAGPPAVLCLWGNLHGSFMLGLGLLGVRAALSLGEYLNVRRSPHDDEFVSSQRVRIPPSDPPVNGGKSALPVDGEGWGGGDFPRTALGETAPNFGSEEPMRLRQDPRRSPARAVFGEFASFTAAVLAVGLLNPYGFDNLLMPFTQVGSEGVTSHSADWTPVWDASVWAESVFCPASAWPFLGLLMLLSVCGILAVRTALREGETRALPRRDVLLELAVAVALVIPALKFRRLILFAGVALVPIVAWVAALCLSRIRCSNLRNYGACFLAVVSATAFCWAAYRATAPYRYGAQPERSVFRELMSYDSFSTGLTTFMRTHGLVDRVFPGWEISGFVMHKIPEVTLFMDCRDQSYYRPEVIRDYFAAVGVLPATPTERLAILNKYDVKYLALTENPIDFDCAMFLMSVGDARCVYADGPAFLLERGANRRGAAFTYENDDVAARTDAWNEYWTVGELSERTTAAVRKTVMSAPSPNLYALLLPRRYETRCMNKDLSAYFTAEIARLTRADATGAGSMPRLESALRITEMLIRNGRNCGANEIPRLTVLRGALVSAIHDLQVMRSGCAIRLPFTGASTQ